MVAGAGAKQTAHEALPTAIIVFTLFCMQFAFSRKKSISPATKICIYLKKIGDATCGLGLQNLTLGVQL